MSELLQEALSQAVLTKLCSGFCARQTAQRQAEMADLFDAILLAESEVYVSDEGWANDDEGHRWYVGRNWPEGTYGGADARRIVGMSRDTGGRSGYRARVPVSGEDQGKRIEAVRKALERDPKSNFLNSIFQQLVGGRGLSSKQCAVVRKILVSMGGTTSAKLFEADETMGDIFRRLER